MLKLAAFADEISPDLNEQIRICRLNGVGYFELRGVAGRNVLDFSEAESAAIRRALTAAGMRVACIGSPVGKTPIDLPKSQQVDRFKKAMDMAEFFSAPLIRVFSYYPAGGEGKGDVAVHRSQVLDLFHEKVALLGSRDITLVHENERGIYGDIGTRCLDLMTTVNSPRLRTAFDFANFVQVGENPMDNWPLLKAFTAHIHIKDAIASTGKVVPAGEGDGHLPAILKDAYESGYRGFLSLEPHLKVAGHSHGETGADLFKVAADALKNVCRENAIALSLFG